VKKTRAEAKPETPDAPKTTEASIIEVRNLADSPAEGPIKMRVKINHVDPVELFDLTACFHAIASEYARFLTKKMSPGYDDTQRDLNLYVHEIRPGSIEIDLLLQTATAAAGAGLFNAPAVNSIVEFCKHIVMLMLWVKDWSYGAAGAADKCDRPMLESAVGIAGVIVNNSSGTSLSVGTVNSGNIFIQHAHFSHDDGKTIQANAREILQSQAKPEEAEWKKVLLYWDQVKNKLGKVETDRAIVDAICPKAVKVYFDSEDIKAQMLTEDKNFFLYAYLVDIRVETVRGKPALYKIKKFHERVPLPE
jgi:hypothetical protein